jgi:hypothetical protein
VLDTLSVDLSQSWSNASVSISGFSLQDPGMQLVRQPATWYDSYTGKVFRYGGSPYLNNSTWSATLWSFVPGGRTVTWSQEMTPSESGLQPGSNAPWGSAWTTNNSTFYSLGGSIGADANWPPSFILPGLVQYDSSAKSWSNDTTDIPQSNPYVDQARAQFAPNFGQQGFMVIVGGANPPQQSIDISEESSLRDMAEVTLYDPSSQTWYVQQATGDIPPPRGQFCMVGRASSDGQTYEL